MTTFFGPESISSPLLCLCAWRALSCTSGGFRRSVKREITASYDQRSISERMWEVDRMSGPLEEDSSLYDQLIAIQATMLETLRMEAGYAWRDPPPGGAVWKRLQEEAQALEPGLRDQLLQGIERLAGRAPPVRVRLPGHCWGGWDCVRQALDDVLMGLGDAEASGALAQAWIRQGRACHWWLPLERVALLSERPCVLGFDARGQLHSENTAAAGYAGGQNWLCAWHGVRVFPRLILDPGSISVQEIEAPRTDPEIRRIMIARYGQGRYLKDSGGRVIHQDKRGLLWRKERRGDAPLVMVEVINSTPEPDGSRQSFMLRVPPLMTSASEAVAWTFGMPPYRYDPVLET